MIESLVGHGSDVGGLGERVSSLGPGARVFRCPKGEIELSARECEVVDCLKRGHSTEQTAARLHVSKNTVRNHIARIYKKLGVHSRVALVGLTPIRDHSSDCAEMN